MNEIGFPRHLRALEWSALLNKLVEVCVNGIWVEHFSPTRQPSDGPTTPSAYSRTKNLDFYRVEERFPVGEHVRFGPMKFFGSTTHPAASTGNVRVDARPLFDFF
ncbi:MAG TPA: hypothetical protein EYQ31_03005 [Candidatus Handelsmanbacteria bacterium]|nr:hypothetical protein [Candidatus Handelsmanbacteria bacterium]